MKKRGFWRELNHWLRNVWYRYHLRYQAWKYLRERRKDPWRRDDE
jgi:hypothetical protein